MKFRKEADPVMITDFWYDLTSGGYIDPDKILEPDDAKRVNDAIKVLREFEDEAIDNGIIEYN